MSKSDADRQTGWMRLESLLYALRLLGAPFSSPSQMVVNVALPLSPHPQIISSLFTLPAITPLELSVFLLLGCYCPLVHDDYGLLERIINYCFSRIGEPDLQPAVAALFRSLCKDCGASITQNADFVGPCVGATSPAEKLLQLHASIPSVMKSDDQCTVRPLPLLHSQIMEGLCTIVRQLPPDQCSHFTSVFLDHQLAVVQGLLAQPPAPAPAAALVTTLQILTVGPRLRLTPRSSSATRRCGRTARPYRRCARTSSRTGRCSS